MHIATAWSTVEVPRVAFDDAYTRLRVRLGGDPSLLLVFYTEAYPAQAMLAAVQDLPSGVRIHGLSICAGVMTEEGFHEQDGRALGLWGLRDPEGAFGVGMVAEHRDAGLAAMQALEQALAQAGRSGETPDLVWVSTSPGSEEAALRGIQEMLGSTVQILGGSAADNNIAGRWSLLTRNATAGNAVVVSVMFPTLASSASFQSGYSPTEWRGRITAASGRVLQRIDTRFAHSRTGAAVALPFERLSFGIDFARCAWFFLHPRLRAGHFRLQPGRSRWRDTQTLQLHYEVSRLPFRGLLYDEVKPLGDTLALGLGGLNRDVGTGDLFFFLLQAG